jgi:hypothetical protein
MQGEMSSGAARYYQGGLGVIIGFAGAFLDFYSGYILLTSSGMGASEMEASTLITQNNSTGFVWGVGVVALGVVLAVTAVASLSLMGARMKDLGALMMVYGLAMLFVGTSMYVGITSMVQGALFPALGMLGVGVLMIANGAMMLRTRTNMG